MWHEQRLPRASSVIALRDSKTHSPTVDSIAREPSAVCCFSLSLARVWHAPHRSSALEVHVCELGECDVRVAVLILAHELFGFGLELWRRGGAAARGV